MLTFFDANVLNVSFILCSYLFVIILYPKIEIACKHFTINYRYLIISTIICLISIVNFASELEMSSKLRSISQLIRVPLIVVLFFISIIFFILALYSIYCIVSLIVSISIKIEIGKNKNIDLKKINLLTLFFILAFIIYFLLLNPGDADLSFHLQRLDAIKNEIVSGGFLCFPIRLYRHTIGGMGYASPLFYCDIFMWPFAALAKITNFSISTTYKLMICFYLILAYFISKYSFSLVFNRNESNVCVFFYITSVTIFSLFSGSWVGRFFSSLFVPLSMCSFYCVINEINNKKNIILLALGVTGVIFGNLLDALIVCFSLIVFLIFCINRINAKIIKNILISAFLCFCLTAWFILPMIEQMLFQELIVTSSSFKQIYDLYWYTIPFIGLILPGKLMLSLYKTLEITPPSATGYYLYGMLLFILVLFYYFMYRKELAFDKTIKALLFLMIIFIIFQTRLFPHRATASITGILQFPIRTNIVMTFIFSVLASLLYSKSRNRKILYSLVSISIVFTIIYALFQCNTYVNYSFTTYDIGCGEYLPSEILKGNSIEDISNVDTLLLERGSNVLCSSNIEYDVEKNNNSIALRYIDANDATIFDLPLIYYKGYTVSNNGEIIEYNKSNIGTIEIKPIYSKGIIEVIYEGTFLQKTASWFSLFSFILLLIYCMYIKCINRKQ